MSTKIVGGNIKRNSSIVNKNMDLAYDKICKANAQCYYLSWSNAISSTNKSVISVLSLAKKIIAKEQGYNKKYINAIKKWDSLNNKIKQAKDSNGIKKISNQSAKKSTKVGYNVKASSNAVSVLNKTKSKGNVKVTSMFLADSDGNVYKSAKVYKSNISSIATLITNVKKNLKNALKSGNFEEAFTIYNSLVGMIGTTKAKKYLNDLGYDVVKNSGNSIVIAKIKSQNTNTTKNETIIASAKDKIKSPANSNDPVKDNSNLNDPNTTEDSGNNNQTSNESVATPSDGNNTLDSSTSNNNSNNSNSVSNVSNNNDNYSDNNSGLVFDDEESDEGTSGVNESNLVPSYNEDNNTVDDTVSKTPTKKVKTLDGDTPKSTSSSKSGLGAAVPLGLGVVATGAAAVAGARYIKNKKDSSYEDENYDDENNNLDEDNGYIDTSSDYSSNDYMSDDYLGPAGSSYTDTNLDENSDNSDDVVDNYIDSEEFENDTNDDDDLVLKDLN